MSQSCYHTLFKGPCPCVLYSCHSKQIQFGVMSPADIINTSEFHVYERALYKVRQSPTLLAGPRKLVDKQTYWA
jgi:hypothetical protein